MSDAMWAEAYGKIFEEKERQRREENGLRVLNGLKWLIENGKINEIRTLHEIKDNFKYVCLYCGLPLGTIRDFKDLKLCPRCKKELKPEFNPYGN